MIIKRKWLFDSEDENQSDASSENVVVEKRSKFSRSKSRSMFSGMNNSEIEASMTGAVNKLTRTLGYIYPNGIDETEVKNFAVLQQFVCQEPVNFEVGSGISCQRNKKDGSTLYWKVSAGKGIKYQAHKLLYCQENNTLYTGLEKQENHLDLSHLCKTKGCCRLSHLTLEDHFKNVKRSSGHSCAGNCWFKKEQLLKLCTHDPQCKVLHVFDSLKDRLE